jgi:hypothetical protein
VKLLTIVVPTYNHASYIEYYLQQSKYIDLLDIILEIHDSSTTDDTKIIVEKYQKDYKNLFYYHYEDIDVDLKTILALKHVKTKYSFLCGDGVILNAINCYDKLVDCMKQNYDIIEIYDSITKKHIDYYNSLCKSYNCAEIIYSNIEKHLVDNIWHMPFYGGSIVKTETFLNVEISNIQHVIGSGFIYPYTIYESMLMTSKAIVLGGDYLIQNIYKQGAIWLMSQKKAIEIWSYKYPKTILLLSTKYSAVNNSVVIASEKVLGYLSFRGLILLKLLDNFNYKIYKQYKKELIKYSGTNRFAIFLVAIFPKFILKGMKKLFSNTKKLLNGNK